MEDYSLLYYRVLHFFCKTLDSRIFYIQEEKKFIEPQKVSKTSMNWSKSAYSLLYLLY